MVLTKKEKRIQSKKVKKQNLTLLKIDKLQETSNHLSNKSTIANDSTTHSSTFRTQSNELTIQASNGESENKKTHVLTPTLLEELIKKHKEEIKKKAEISTFKLQMHYKNNCIVPLGSNQRPYLYASDLRDVTKKILCSSNNLYSSRWSRLSNLSKISKVITIFIEEATENDYIENIAEFTFISNYFQTKMCFINPEIYSLSFEKEFFNFNYQEKANKSVRSTKLDILLTHDDLKNEEFVLPFYNKGLIKDFIFSKSKYLSVSNKSDLYGLDCEMVETSAGKEVAWISIVNEKLETVYESLVKPANTITNYLTKFSGITKKILKGVKTRLIDVQIMIDKILSQNAILVGHSLKYDLHALKIFHPYIIDTSVIYNLSGNKSKKPRLKELAAIFLNREIQSNDLKGHNPREDAEVTMQLVQLKLQNDKRYGDVSLGWTMSDLKTKNKNQLVDDIKTEQEVKEFENQKDAFIPNYSSMQSLFQCVKNNHKRIVSVGICSCSLNGKSCKSKLSNKLTKRISRTLLHHDSSAFQNAQLISILFPVEQIIKNNSICCFAIDNLYVQNSKDNSNLQKLKINEISIKTNGQKRKSKDKDVLSNVCTNFKNDKEVKCMKDDNEYVAIDMNVKKTNSDEKLIFKNELPTKLHKRKRHEIDTTEEFDQLKNKRHCGEFLDAKISGEDAKSNEEETCGKMLLSNDKDVQDQDLLFIKLHVPTISSEDNEKNMIKIKNYAKLDGNIQHILKDIKPNTFVLLVFGGNISQDGLCFIKLSN